MKKVGILGAGTWGSAIAKVLCEIGNYVRKRKIEHIIGSFLGMENQILLNKLCFFVITDR